MKKVFYLMNTRKIGTQGEDRAAEWLLSRGLKIIQRNFRGRGFEVDIIALDRDNVLRFVEVKHIRNGSVTDAALSVENRNISNYIKAAETFIFRNPSYGGLSSSMDVVMVQGDLCTLYENVTRDRLL